MLDPLYEENTSLNHTINQNEVENAVFRAKNGKASGIESGEKPLYRHYLKI